MPIIYRYIIKKFISTFIYTLGLFICIAIIFDFSEKIDDFIDSQAPLSAIVFDYYLNFIPYFMNLFSPLFIFISAIYFTARMASNTEFIPILSSGMNFYKLLVPYLMVGAMLAGISYYLNGWVIPKGNRHRIAFETQYLKRPYINTDYHIHRQLAPGTFMYMESYDYQDTVGFRFSLEKFEDQLLRYKLLSRSVSYDAARDVWIALDYDIREIDGIRENYISGDSLELDLPISPEDFGRKEMAIQAMTNEELNEFIETERMRGEQLVNYYIVERYKRASMPFATIVLVALALAISSRRVRGGMGAHLGLGLLLAFSYILVLQFASTFGVQSNFPPILAVWTPNILYGALAIIMLYRAPK